MEDSIRLFSKLHSYLDENKYEEAILHLKESFVYKPGARDEYENNLLHIVAQACNEDIEIVTEYLLDIGCNINVKNVDNLTPFAVAILNNNIRVAKILLKKGPILYNSYYHELNGPLHLAGRTNDYDMFKLLIDSGCDVTDRNEYDETPLHCLLKVKDANVDIVKMLIDAGADVNASNCDGETPLHLTTNDKVAKLLLRKGANPDALTELLQLPLHCALIKEADCKTVKTLVKVTSKINYLDVFKRTPLHYACTSLDNKIVKLLINKGASTTLLDFQKLDPLCFGLKNSLIGAKFRASYAELHIYSRENNSVRPETLNNTDVYQIGHVDYLDYRDITHTIYQNKQAWVESDSLTDNTLKSLIACLKTLFKYGARINQDKIDNSPLCMALTNIPHSQVIGFLLKQGAILDFKHPSVETLDKMYYAMEVIIAHAALLRESQSPCLRNFNKHTLHDSGDKAFLKHCVAELQLLRKVVIKKTDINYMTLLLAKSLPACACNPGAIRDLFHESIVIRRFPIYGYQLRKQYFALILEYQIRESLGKLLKMNKDSFWEVYNMILFYLDEEDKKNLARIYYLVP